jgi:signal transduction histidine kinase/ligand-binding sensor domain-containing protein
VGHPQYLLPDQWFAEEEPPGALETMKDLGESTAGKTRVELGRTGGWLSPARFVILAVLATLSTSWLTALEPTTPVASYGRQSWVMENGLPQNTVQALAQTRDGFVWLGTEVGLVRFDGNGFTVFDRNSSPALPGSDVRCLLAARDGSLWIGTSDGLARLKDGTVRVYTSKDGLPGDSIRFLSIRDGNLLVTTEGGEAGINEDRVTGVTSEKLTSIDPRLEPIFVTKMAGGRQAQATTTEVAVFGNSNDLQLRTGHELPGTKVQALFADREDTLWIGTNGGLVRFAEGKLEKLPVTDPLATASILAIMEDREGNLWVGTEAGGLHILRDQRFKTLGAREGLSSDGATTVVEDSAGIKWVGTAGGGLNAIQPDGKVKTYLARDGLLSDVILSLAAAPDGDLWIGTPDGLNRLRKGKIDAFTSADGLPDDFIRSLWADADGTLWIGTRRGLVHWAVRSGATAEALLRARMEVFTQASGLGSDLVGAMVRDTAGDLWVATFAGLSRLHGGKITNFTMTDGLSSNVVTALLPRANGTLLIGTQDHGWNLWDGRHFLTPGRNGPNSALAQTTIHAVLEDAGNHLWFATANGIARCDCDMMGGCSRWIEFGTADGLRSRETATNSHPSAWKSRNGHLWFATPKGLVEVDPAHFPVNTVAPPVALVRFAVDDLPQPINGTNERLRIAAGHVHFEFDYAGLSFTAPQKVRYRFMLEGFDKDWTEAGARRAAYYNAIPPGKYTFRVQAANNDGVWNTEGAGLEFELRPHFYQTIWFYALLLALAGGLVALFLRLRLQRAEGEFKAVLGERSRIAREIHDTLAQGYVGISVQLEVLAELLRQKKTDAAAKHLDVTRDYVREGLADARQSIWALRSQDADETTLPIKIRRLVEAENGRGMEASFSSFGAYRPIPPGMEREILRVAQEAIHNVRKHAGASHLSVQLEYGAEKIALEVRDDGRGFAVAKQPESPAGHYGLTGMRERADAIGGRLDVSSEPDNSTGSGTVVRLEAAVPRETRESVGD